MGRYLVHVGYSWRIDDSETQFELFHRDKVKRRSRCCAFGQDIVLLPVVDFRGVFILVALEQQRIYETRLAGVGASKNVNLWWKSLVLQLSFPFGQYFKDLGHARRFLRRRQTQVPSYVRTNLHLDLSLHPELQPLRFESQWQRIYFVDNYQDSMLT